MMTVKIMLLRLKKIISPHLSSDDNDESDLEANNRTGIDASFKEVDCCAGVDAVLAGEPAGYSNTMKHLNNKSPCQPILSKYKQSWSGKEMRSFVAVWFTRDKWKDWLEYDEASDAAFCFACRIYLTESGTNYKRDVFSTTGYRNWKKATETDKGFTQHCNSMSHIDAMKLYNEHIERRKKG